MCFIWCIVYISCNILYGQNSPMYHRCWSPLFELNNITFITFVHSSCQSFIITTFHLIRDGVVYFSLQSLYLGLGKNYM